MRYRKQIAEFNSRLRDIRDEKKRALAGTKKAFLDRAAERFQQGMSRFIPRTHHDDIAASSATASHAPANATTAGAAAKDATSSAPQSPAALRRHVSTPAKRSSIAATAAGAGAADGHSGSDGNLHHSMFDGSKQAMLKQQMLQELRRSGDGTAPQQRQSLDRHAKGKQEEQEAQEAQTPGGRVKRHSFSNPFKGRLGGGAHNRSTEHLHVPQQDKHGSHEQPGAPLPASSHSSANSPSSGRGAKQQGTARSPQPQPQRSPSPLVHGKGLDRRDHGSTSNDSDASAMSGYSQSPVRSSLYSAASPATHTPDAGSRSNQSSGQQSGGASGYGGPPSPPLAARPRSSADVFVLDNGRRGSQRQRFASLADGAVPMQRKQQQQQQQQQQEEEEEGVLSTLHVPKSQTDLDLQSKWRRGGDALVDEGAGSHYESHSEATFTDGEGHTGDDTNGAESDAGGKKKSKKKHKKPKNKRKDKDKDKDKRDKDKRDKDKRDKSKTRATDRSTSVESRRRTQAGNNSTAAAAAAAGGGGNKSDGEMGETRPPLSAADLLGMDTLGRAPDTDDSGTSGGFSRMRRRQSSDKGQRARDWRADDGQRRQRGAGGAGAGAGAGRGGRGDDAEADGADVFYRGRPRHTHGRDDTNQQSVEPHRGDDVGWSGKASKAASSSASASSLTLPPTAFTPGAGSASGKHKGRGSVSPTPSERSTSSSSAKGRERKGVSLHESFGRNALRLIGFGRGDASSAGNAAAEEPATPTAAAAGGGGGGGSQQQQRQQQQEEGAGTAGGEESGKKGLRNLYAQTKVLVFSFSFSVLHVRPDLRVRNLSVASVLILPFIFLLGSDL